MRAAPNDWKRPCDLPAAPPVCLKPEAMFVFVSVFFVCFFNIYVLLSRGSHKVLQKTAHVRKANLLGRHQQSSSSYFCPQGAVDGKDARTWDSRDCVTSLAASHCRGSERVD